VMTQSSACRAADLEIPGCRAQEIFDNILNRRVEWPKSGMSEECRDLVDRLLQPDPEQRLGHAGTAELKAHPWFRGLNWDNLAQAKAAFVPHLDSDTDTTYFAPKPVNPSLPLSTVPPCLPQKCRSCCSWVDQGARNRLRCCPGVAAEHGPGHIGEQGSVAHVGVAARRGVHRLLTQHQHSSRHALPCLLFCLAGPLMPR
jgi:hypothetical protein